MKRWIGILFLCFLALVTSACGNEIQDEEGRLIVFEFNEQYIYLDEVSIYAQTTIESYEKEYGEDIWGTVIVTDDGIEMDVEEMARREIISDIVKTKVLVAQAESYGISLTNEEIAAQENKADEFYNTLTDEQIASVDMELETVKTVMKENLLADKVYNYVMQDNTAEVSDEQARMTTFYDMFFECYYEDDFGNIIVYDGARIQEQKERATDAYSTILEGATNPDFNIVFLGHTYNLKYAGSHTMSRFEILDTYGQETLDVLYSMDDGDISQVVETEYGYHIFQMTALTDRVATAENKAQLSKEADRSYFDNLMNRWLADMDSDYSYGKRVNESVYDRIVFR